MTQTERRRFQRIVLNRPVSLVVDGESYPGQLMDISLRGALIKIEGKPLPPEGSTGMADVALSNDPEFMIRMRITVRHRHDGLLGLSAVALDLDDASCLKRLVELNVADPGVLYRELEELLTA